MKQIKVQLLHKDVVLFETVVRTDFGYKSALSSATNERKTQNDRRPYDEVRMRDVTANK